MTFANAIQQSIIKEITMNFHKNPEGVLLIATGDRHIEEAIQAVSRIKFHLQNRPISLVTDQPNSIPLGIFEAVYTHPNPTISYRDKIPPLIDLPYARTLFLDTDVELLTPINDLYEILKEMDVVGCHAPVRWCQWKDTDVPEGFCELNSGVIGLRRSRRQKKLIKRWLQIYDEAKVSFDQASLRSALWWATKYHNLRSWILPPEYNLRTPKPWLTGAGMPVKILHGRIPNKLRNPLIKYLNEDINQFRSSSSFPTGQNQLVKPTKITPNTD